MSVRGTEERDKGNCSSYSCTHTRMHDRAHAHTSGWHEQNTAGSNLPSTCQPHPAQRARKGHDTTSVRATRKLAEPAGGDRRDGPRGLRRVPVVADDTLADMRRIASL